MLQKKTFLNQIPMYFAVVEAYILKEIDLDLCEIRSIHHCLDTGLQYILERDEDNNKKIKQYKVLLKNRIAELERKNGSKISIKNVDIQEIYYRLPKDYRENSNLSDELEVESLHT